LQSKHYNEQILLIIEISLKQLQKLLIYQRQIQTDLMNNRQKFLTEIGKTLSQPISNLENNIYNSRNNEKEILANNLIKLRTALNVVGVCTAEKVENYLCQVDFDANIHKASKQITTNGYVKSLGVKVNEEVLSYAELDEKGLNNYE
jgi:hypothetical protein